MARAQHVQALRAAERTAAANAHTAAYSLLHAGQALVRAAQQRAFTLMAGGEYGDEVEAPLREAAEQVDREQPNLRRAEAALTAVGPDALLPGLEELRTCGTSLAVATWWVRRPLRRPLPGEINERILLSELDAASYPAAFNPSPSDSIRRRVTVYSDTAPANPEAELETAGHRGCRRPPTGSSPGGAVVRPAWSALRTRPVARSSCGPPGRADHGRSPASDAAARHARSGARPAGRALPVPGPTRWRVRRQSHRVAPARCHYTRRGHPFAGRAMRTRPASGTTSLHSPHPSR